MNTSLRSPTSALRFESKGSHMEAKNGSCLVVRHTPHPRRVCHIKGLNNIPICTVNDDENSFGTLWGVGQLNHLKKDEVPCPPSTAALGSTVREVSPGPHRARVPPPRPHSEPCRKIKECFKTSSENPLVIKKEEVKAKNPPLPPKAHATAGSSEVMSTKTSIKENTICIPNYLDQEIKILAKLCDILRTDSLAEVLQWLLHAGAKEKEWVSALIHAELTEINLLAHLRGRSISAEAAAEAGKPPKVKSPPNSPGQLKKQTRSEEEHQPTSVSRQGTEGNKEVPKEDEHKPTLFIRRNKMTIPVAEYFSKPMSPSGPQTQESIPTKPASARSLQQGHNLSPQKAFSPLTYQR